MPDLIFAVAFIAMVAAPAMVATLGGRKEYNPGPDPDPEIETSPNVRPSRPPGARVIRPFSAQKSAAPDRGLIITDEATLPMHNGRGMANR
jgi:hypothetical protein